MAVTDSDSKQVTHWQFFYDLYTLSPHLIQLVTIQRNMNSLLVSLEQQFASNTAEITNKLLQIKDINPSSDQIC